jgi:hypothetical protein
MTRTSSALVALGGSLACIFSVTLHAAPAAAAPPLVERGITLPRHDWAFDFGLGIGHAETLPDPVFRSTGVGLNVEGAVAVTDHLELGLRTGIRLGDDGRFTRADAYGRLFDRQTFGTYTDTIADPEFRIRGALVHGPIVELALEGRASLPIERGSYFGMMFGMPLMFHLGHRVRLDTGIFVPVVFEPRTASAISAPLDVWIQATNRLWLGPMTGVGVRTAPGNSDVAVSLGFGLGYSITRTIDFKAMFLFPRINQSEGARNFGTGAGVQIRIE